VVPVADKKIDSLKTRQNIRAQYGSVFAFCRSAKISNNYLSLLLTEPRRGTKPGEGLRVLAFLKEQNLIAYTGENKTFGNNATK
jgi:hypothetical protein